MIRINGHIYAATVNYAADRIAATVTGGSFAALAADAMAAETLEVLSADGETVKGTYWIRSLRSIEPMALPDAVRVVWGVTEVGHDAAAELAARIDDAEAGLMEAAGLAAEAEAANAEIREQLDGIEAAILELAALIGGTNNESEE